MMDDAISRQAAIDALHEWERVYTWDENCLEDREKVYAPSEVIEDLPAARPEPLTDKGKWIPVTNGRGGFECENCHHYAPAYQNGVEWLSNYCPNCGVKKEKIE